MSKSITKNLIYNILLQIVTLAVPLITTPYISRVLGKEGVGTYSYTYSIVQYFIIIGTLGIAMYGNRSIAYVRDDKKCMSKTFWAITILKFITCGISYILFLIFFCFNSKYSYLYTIQSINIIGAMFDISWFYMGLEDFKKTVTRNIMVKFLGVISIFLFVNDKNDIIIYAAITAIMALLGNIVMWLYLPKLLCKTRVKIKDVVNHVIPTIKLFIPQVAIQIYSILDKTMLGVMTTTSEVGLYEQSQKIVKMVLAVVTSLGVVMMPRMSNIFANGDNEKMKEYLNLSLIGVACVSIPMSFGLAAISNEFVPWFFGKDFNAVSILMVLLTPILFLISMNTVLGTQQLLPSNRNKEFTISVTVGAILNVVFNIVLIPKYHAIGACISSVVAEFFVTLIQYIYLRDEIDNREIFISLSRYIGYSIVMYIVVRIVGICVGQGIVTTLLQGIVGVSIYIILLVVFNDKFFKNCINKFLKKN